MSHQVVTQRMLLEELMTRAQGEADYHPRLASAAAAVLSSRKEDWRLDTPTASSQERNALVVAVAATVNVELYSEGRRMPPEPYEDARAILWHWVFLKGGDVPVPS